MKYILLVSAPLLLVMLCSCATVPGYERFYEENIHSEYNPISETNVILISLADSDAVKEFAKYTKRLGYIFLGSSSWEGPYTSPNLAKRKAAMIGANVVGVCITYSHTRSGTLMSPQYHPSYPSSQTHHHSGTLFTPNGASTYSGTSTTTSFSPGFTTYTPIPISIDRYDHMAFFFRTERDASPLIRDMTQSIPTNEASVLLYLHGVAATQSTNIDVYTLMGDIYGRYGYYHEALSNYQYAITLDPTNSIIRYFVAYTQLNIGNEDDAIENFNQINADDYMYIMAQETLGEFYLRNKYDYITSKPYFLAVIDQYESSATFNPAHNNAIINSYIGLALISHHNSKISLACDYMYKAGIACMQLNDRERALDIADYIREYDPDSPSRSKLLEYIYSSDYSSTNALEPKISPNHGLESTGAPPAAETPETHP